MAIEEKTKKEIRALAMMLAKHIQRGYITAPVARSMVLLFCDLNYTQRRDEAASFATNELKGFIRQYCVDPPSIWEKLRKLDELDD